MTAPIAIRVVDSHTEGEPTRVVVDGWPQPPGATMAARRDALGEHFDHLRRGVVREPRGHDAVVGALLTPPVEPGSACGVVFFNDVGYLGMCGHGLIGVTRTLIHLGRIAGGSVSVDTPVGTVSAECGEDGLITIRSVPAYCDVRDLAVDVPGLGTVTGDVAWGGNWFFIAPWDVSGDVRTLSDAARRIRDVVQRVDPRVNHIELYGAPTRADAHARNFVLCPGDAYDRSPCGTGTCAKMAVLHARGELAVGDRWRQEGVSGSLFTGWLEESGGALVPRIQGRAYITGEATLRFGADDPFRWGIPGGIPEASPA